ncbi:MAG TPA: polysaccharide lyase family protein, partial [Terriglobia bacterium]|nr:polysaccharide lyase family protein [Terriglobia bacterium]
MRARVQILVLLLLTVLFGACARGDAAPQVVWQIGKFNLSSADLNQSSPGPPLFGFSFPKGKIVFTAGQSIAHKDWPAFQPGSANGAAGAHPYPYTIRFNLAGAPRGTYTLKIGMLVQTKRLSILQFDLNGHQGRAYQRPEWIDVPGKKHWRDVVSAELPSRFLNSGTNQLVVTAIDEPSERDDVSNPGIVYDALELDQDAARKSNPSKITAEVVPTIFYKNEDGKLTELLDVYVHQNSPSRRGRVILAIQGQNFTQPLSPAPEFGEQRVRLAVPEFSPGTEGELTVTLHSRSQRFREILSPAKKWNVLVVPHIHLDVGFTDYQAKVAEIQSRVLDEAMRMIHQHPDFRFSPDGYWVFQQFFAGRNAHDRQRLLQLIEQKKIFVPAQYANILTGFPTVETLIRSLYPSFRFDKKHGENFDYANITDVPSYSWSYASVLAAAGLKYFLAGCDQIRGPILSMSHLQEKSPFWWEGPDGKRILMWYSNGYGQIADFFGLPPQVVTGEDALPRFLQTYPAAEYKPDTMLLFGAQYENSDLYPQDATLAEQWDKTYAYPKLNYTNFADAMAVIAREAGNSIPVVRGDGGPYWEDGIASDAYYAAMNRESEQRALSAERISTLSSLINPHAQTTSSLLRRMWQNLLLFDEHTWGAFASITAPRSEQSVRQLAVKDAFATKAHQQVQYVLDRSMAAIADEIHEPSGTWIVFNPLNWQRSGLVEIDLPKGSGITDLTTHQAVAYEVLSSSGSYEHIRFLAQDVPAVGYKCYSIGKAKPQPPAPASTQTVLENAYYRVTLDPKTGAVKSVFDKALQKELVDSGAYDFDQYLYVSGGDKPERNRLLNYDNNFSAPLPKLTVYGEGGGRILSVEKEPFGTVARLESSDFNTPRIETEVILFDGQKKIEFINHVRKTAVDSKEGVYFAFPFTMDHPQFRYEIQNGFVDPARDQLPGTGKEWFSVQHWIEAQQDGITAAIVPVDASLVTLGDIWRGNWPLKFGQRHGTIFSYVMNNYWWTNYRAAQGGDFTFRYVLTSGRDLTPAALSRLGRSEMTPLEIDDIVSNDKAVNTPEPLNAPQG